MTRHVGKVPFPIELVPGDFPLVIDVVDTLNTAETGQDLHDRIERGRSWLFGMLSRKFVRDNAALREALMLDATLYAYQQCSLHQ